MKRLALGRDPLANPEPLIRSVYAYVAYRVGPGATAEDVTSEVFERALRYRESYDPRRGKPLAWLIGIARRAIDDAARRAEEPLEPPDRPAPDDLEEAALARVTVAEAVGRLEGRDRELIALRYGADLTAREIGDVLGMRTNAVEVALHRALARLRGELEDEDAGEPREQDERAA